MTVHTSLLPCCVMAALLPPHAVTPRGFYTVPSSGATIRCPQGTYRANWAAAGLAVECIACGSGLFSSNDTVVLDLSPVDNSSTPVPVTTKSSSCCELLAAWVVKERSYHKQWKQQQNRALLYRVVVLCEQALCRGMSCCRGDNFQPKQGATWAGCSCTHVCLQHFALAAAGLELSCTHACLFV